MSKRGFAALLALLLCGSPALAAELPPAGGLGEESCGTVEELVERVALDRGGTVAVAGNLVLSKTDSVYLEVEKPVTIDLGEYGISIPPGASLTLSGPIRLVGRGVPQPLLQVEGDLTTRRGVELAAAGDRAVALALLHSEQGGWTGSWNMEETSIAAEGDCACAVYASGGDALTLYRLELRAGGGQAVAVRADVPVVLRLSTAVSSGSLADAPELILDASSADPLPAEARVIRRAAGPGDTLSENGLCLPVGAPAEELERLLEERLGDLLGYALYDCSGEEPAVQCWVPGAWTGETVDLSRTGNEAVTGVPEEAELGDMTLPERTVPVHVVDPGAP